MRKANDEDGGSVGLDSSADGLGAGRGSAEYPHTLPLMLAADNAGLTGFVRIVNRTAQAGNVQVHAIDDTGRRFGPVILEIGATRAVNLNSRDLERGNTSKGLPSGVGDGDGNWRLELATALDIQPLAYIRTTDGFVTAMHDVAPANGQDHRVPFFNPGSNTRQVSRLRLINPGTTAAEVEVTGRDDAGAEAPGGAVRLTQPAGASRMLTAQALEDGGEGFDGRLGDGAGKWRLSVTSNAAIEVMSLLRSPTGHLANLSTVPEAPESGAYALPLVLPADYAGLEGFVRIVNLSALAGNVRIHAIDDTGRRFGSVTLEIGSGAAVNFNSRDLEQGNTSKGLPDGVGDGEGNWRLELDSALDIGPLAYIRTADGFVTGMHDVASVKGQVHRVPFFNPGANQNQVSRLRLINPGPLAAEVTISGVDDAGDPAPGGTVGLMLPAGMSRTLTASELEVGGNGFDGHLGDGTGKWRLSVTSNATIEVMSLLRSPTGHLSNLSTEPAPDVPCGTVSETVVRVTAGGSETVTLTDYIEDPDAGPLTFAVSGVPSGWSVTTSGANLTLTAGAGAADVRMTVTATDLTGECWIFPLQVQVEDFPIPEMVVVPGGSFLMGSPESDIHSYRNERPQHLVTIPSFAVGKYEVTFEEWDACVDDGGCGVRPRKGWVAVIASDEGWGRGRRPVINVSWRDAKTYVEWLSRVTGDTYRLLSESEWEYVARAGTTGPFHFGSTITPEQANYGLRWRMTLPVGSFSANAFGLYDVHGNVQEWVEDCYHDSYDGAPSDGSAWVYGVSIGYSCSNYKVLRGGSWRNQPSYLRSARRSGGISNYRYNFTGFRVARTLD